MINNINNIYIGNLQISEVFVGNTKAFPSDIVDTDGLLSINNQKLTTINNLHITFIPNIDNISTINNQNLNTINNKNIALIPFGV